MLSLPELRALAPELRRRTVELYPGPRGEPRKVTLEFTTDPVARGWAEPASGGTLAWRVVSGVPRRQLGRRDEDLIVTALWNAIFEPQNAARDAALLAEEEARARRPMRSRRLL